MGPNRSIPVELLPERRVQIFLNPRERATLRGPEKDGRVPNGRRSHFPVHATNDRPESARIRRRGRLKACFARSSAQTWDRFSPHICPRQHFEMWAQFWLLVGVKRRSARHSFPKSARMKTQVFYLSTCSHCNIRLSWSTLLHMM